MVDDYALEAVHFVPNKERTSNRLGRADILVKPLGLRIEKMSVIYGADAVRVVFARSPVLNGNHLAIRDDKPVFARNEHFPDRADYMKFSERALRAIEDRFPGALAEVIDNKRFSDRPPFPAAGGVPICKHSNGVRHYA